MEIDILQIRKVLKNKNITFHNPLYWSIISFNQRQNHLKHQWHTNCFIYFTCNLGDQHNIQIFWSHSSFVIEWWGERFCVKIWGISCLVWLTKDMVSTKARLMYLDDWSHRSQWVFSRKIVKFGRKNPLRSKVAKWGMK